MAEKALKLNTVVKALVLAVVLPLVIVIIMAL